MYAANDQLISKEIAQGLLNETIPADLLPKLVKQVGDAAREKAGWRIAGPANETFTLAGTGTDKLFLPTLHINSVASVTENGTLVDPDSYEWDEAGYLLGRQWSTKRRSVVVMLNHGFEECPGDLAGVVAEATARGALAPSSGVTGETTLGASVQFSRAASGAAAGRSFLPHELETVNRYLVKVRR